jgi:RNA polymerase sigma factor (sigma-70 family)
MLTQENKTIPLDHLIKECLAGNIKMQKLLYQKFSSPMYYVCLRYVKNATDAEDVLQEGFIKVFKNLDAYKNAGSFEGWVRRIMIRTSLSYLRDNKKHNYFTNPEESMEDKGNHVVDKLSEKEILGTVTKLPSGFKKIFILYAIEGYNHREIAAILGCSEGTCKSQFYRSRTRLQKILLQNT